MARKSTADPGLYNRPCQIQTLARTDDGQGGNSNTTWETICSPFIHISTSQGAPGASRSNSSRPYQYGQLYPTARHWAEMRYRSSVTIDGTMTLLHRGRRYQILDAINLDEEDVTILLPLAEFQSQGTKARQ